LLVVYLAIARGIVILVLHKTYIRVGSDTESKHEQESAPTGKLKENFKTAPKMTKALFSGKI